MNTKELLKFTIADTNAEIRNSKNKLLSRLKSLQGDIEVEINKINNEQIYEPTNSLGIVGETGDMIDILISDISARNDDLKSLMDIKEMSDKE